MAINSTPKFVRGEKVLYYGKVVTILTLNNNNTAYVSNGREKFIVDFCLLEKVQERTGVNRKPPQKKK